MARITPVTIPKWGIEMQEGTITEWRLGVGDAVARGDELVDIESDKIVNTLEAPASGVLRRIVAEAEATLAVGQLLAVIAEADVDEAAVEAFIAAFVPADASFGIGEEVTANASAPAPATAAEPAAAEGEARVSPVARRLAEKLGVDLSTVTGTGRNGRISSADVEAAAAAVSTAAPAGAALSGRALSAARRMAEAKRTVPHFYLERELDMRAALAAKSRENVPLTALLLKALAEALAVQPRVNAHFRDDTVFAQAGAAINVAVDTPEGLVAPLLRDCDTAAVGELATRLKDLAARARERKLAAADLEPGGITLSNLGMFGIDRFSAIVTPPQLAILAVGRTRPMVLEAGAEPVPAMSATLSCDHRVLDGAAGARFLDALQQALDRL